MLKELNKVDNLHGALSVLTTVLIVVVTVYITLTWWSVWTVGNPPIFNGVFS